MKTVFIKGNNKKIYREYKLMYDIIVIGGGAAGLGRRVSGVNLTDTPDYARWLAQGELLITTGFAIADDPQAVDALLPTAAAVLLRG